MCGESATVAGGNRGTAGGPCSFIGGGSVNTINALANAANIVGGLNHTINGTGDCSVIGGGSTNTTSGLFSFIGAGEKNTIKTGHNCAAVVGSNINSVSANLLHANSLYLVLSDIPTSDPGVEGVVWNSSGTLKVSQ